MLSLFIIVIKNKQPVYMIKIKVALLEGRLLSSQSEQFKKYSKSLDWLEKGRPSKEPLFFDHVNTKQANNALTLRFLMGAQKYFWPRAKGTLLRHW